jgi:hypothetical protein
MDDSANTFKSMMANFKNSYADPVKKKNKSFSEDTVDLNKVKITPKFKNLRKMFRKGKIKVDITET